MRLVLVGVNARDAAVLGVFLARDLPGWGWQLTPVDQGSVYPPADILVLDMLALGLTPHNEAHQTALLQRTQGTPAVLLIPGFEQGWAALPPSWLATSHCVVLTKPYGTQTMRDALKAAAALVPVVPPLGTPIPVPQPEIPSLTAAALLARLAALPPAQGGVFLRQLSRFLQQEQPFEVRFTVNNTLIVHPEDGWVASNTPLSVIQQVCRSDVLASAVTLRALDGPLAEERTHSLGLSPTELDAFLWALADSTLPHGNPAP